MEEKNNATPEKKVKSVKYALAWIKWIIDIVGAVIEHVRNNPSPKKEDYLE